jgi:hypothetical protein
MSLDDGDALARAAYLLEGETLASRFTGAIGGRLDAASRILPPQARRLVGAATAIALKTALRASLWTLRADEVYKPSADRWHKAVAAASGACGGALGLAALAVELPISTTILLRSIAEIARSEGEDLADPEAALACLEVFALGGEDESEVGVETGYLAVRAALAREVTASARFLLGPAIAGGSAPIMTRLISQVAARFGLAVSEKAIAQGAPLIGAAGGAAINAAFADHFQALARGHFIVRRLERRYGTELVRSEFRQAREARRASNPRASRSERDRAAA